MIIERPGEPNDRELFIGNLDQDVDLDKYRENYDKIDWKEERPCLCDYPNKKELYPEGYCIACGGVIK